VGVALNYYYWYKEKHNYKIVSTLTLVYDAIIYY
jgi:hypothetical protein